MKPWNSLLETVGKGLSKSEQVSTGFPVKQ